METIAALKLLNEELKARDISREIIICGGAALIALSITTRGTKDVDVLKPKIDPDFKEAANAVASKLKLAANWLNNGPAALNKELPSDWESQCVPVFNGSHLCVKSLGRRDLIFSKLYASADRITDVDDLVTLKPSDTELQAARAWVLQQDASQVWPRIVDECLVEVRKRLGYGG